MRLRRRPRPGLEALQVVLVVALAAVILAVVFALWSNYGPAARARVVDLSELPLGVVLACVAVAGLVALFPVGRQALTNLTRVTRMAVLEALSRAEPLSHEEVRAAVRGNPLYRFSAMWFFPQLISEALAGMLAEGRLELRAGRYARAGAPKPPAAPGAVPATPADARVFICYRRADSQDITGRIYDMLAGRFTRGAVFKDVDDLPAAVHFPTYLEGVIRAVRVVLVVIGPKWLRPDAARPTPLADPGDFVRLEVEAAFRAGAAVMPVTVGNAAMPAAADLPEAVRALAFLHAVPVRPDPDFHRDMARLLARIAELLERPAPG